MLVEILSSCEGQTIIFCDNKTRVDKVCEFLRVKEIKNLPYYENIKSAQARNTTIALLQSGQLPVIVSDRLGSRGLDTMGIQNVIQFDMAKSASDFLHRVGRVGRLGQPGKVTNFIRKKTD